MQRNIKVILKMVRMYLDEKVSRKELCRNFPYELEKRFDKMRLEDWELTELIYDRLLEDGVYCSDGLPDEDFRYLISQQYKDVLDTNSDRFN